MKSYDEIYQNVLRRRDEQMAKKRRRIAVAGSVVLPAVMLTAAVGIGAAAWQAGLPETNVSMEPSAANTDYGTYNLMLSEAKLGDDLIVSQYTLDQYTVTYELKGLTFLPDDYNDTYTSNSAVLTLSNSNNDMEYSYWIPLGSTNGSFKTDLCEGHIRDSVKLLKTENGHYIIMLRKYDHEYDNYAAIFFACEPASYVPGGQLYQYRLYRDGAYTDDYKVVTTDLLQVMEDSTFLDMGVEYDKRFGSTALLRFDTEKCTFTYSLSEEPFGDYVAANARADGYKASYELINVKHLPGREADYYTADNAVITVTDPDGRTASAPVSDFFYGKIFYDQLNGSHAGESLKIFTIEYGGERHYILALRNYYVHDYYDPETHMRPDGAIPEELSGTINYDTYMTLFFALEPQCFEDGRLRIYQSGTADRSDDCYIVAASDNLRVKEDNILVDTRVDISAANHYYEFDPEHLVFKWYTSDNAEAGGSIEIASDYLDGYHAYLTLDMLKHLPEEGKNYYSAETAMLTVEYSDGEYEYFMQIELGSPYESTPELKEEFEDRLNARHTGDILKILRLEADGEPHYILMLRNYHDGHDEDGQPYFHTVLFGIDLGNVELRPYTLYDSYNGEIDAFASVETVEIKNKEGRDILVTQAPIYRVWIGDAEGYCEVVIEFDHENRSAFFTPLFMDSME